MNWRMYAAFVGWRFPLAALLILLIGVYIGIHFFHDHPRTAVYRSQGVLTNSLLGFEIDTRGEFAELHPIENTVRQFITERQKEGNVRTISVYFRLLNSGRWFAINDEEKYSPASLLKIPIMMAYFKKAEERPEILREKLPNAGAYEDTEQSTIPEGRTLERDVSYTVEDLIDRMIRDSNNEAKFLLEEHLPSDFISTIYDELEVKNPYTESGDFMGVSDYPFFLRVLYNTTYLNQNYSEKALDLLTRSSFSEGLPAKLPPSIKVAHKFGFRVTPEYGELHDCGIVYYPDHPYVLCVMTKGYARDPLISTIQDLSLLTYKGVEDFFKAR